jgi:hypothetical protein
MQAAQILGVVENAKMNTMRYSYSFSIWCIFLIIGANAT